MSLFTALDAYLATAPLPELLAYVSLAILSIGLGPFAVANVIEHVADVRGEVR